MIERLAGHDFTRCWLNLGLLMHIRIHARYQQSYRAAGDGGKEPPKARRLSTAAQLNMIRALEGTVKGLEWKPEGTEWADHYQGDSYEEDSLEQKKTLVAKYLASIRPAVVWDLGREHGRLFPNCGRDGRSGAPDSPTTATRRRRWVSVGGVDREDRVHAVVLEFVFPADQALRDVEGGYAGRERVDVLEAARAAPAAPQPCALSTIAGVSLVASR